MLSIANSSIKESIQQLPLMCSSSTIRYIAKFPIEKLHNIEFNVDLNMSFYINYTFLNMYIKFTCQQHFYLKCNFLLLCIKGFSCFILDENFFRCLLLRCFKLFLFSFISNDLCFTCSYNTLVQTGCKDHTNKPVEFYCEKDDQLTCSFCMLMGEHVGHEVKTLENKV